MVDIILMILHNKVIHRLILIQWVLSLGAQREAIIHKLIIWNNCWLTRKTWLNALADLHLTLAHVNLLIGHR